MPLQRRPKKDKERANSQQSSRESVSRQDDRLWAAASYQSLPQYQRTMSTPGLDAQYTLSSSDSVGYSVSVSGNTSTKTTKRKGLGGLFSSSSKDEKDKRPSLMGKLLHPQIGLNMQQVSHPDLPASPVLQPSPVFQSSGDVLLQGRRYGGSQWAYNQLDLSAARSPSVTNGFPSAQSSPRFPPSISNPSEFEFGQLSRTVSASDTPVDSPQRPPLQKPATAPTPMHFSNPFPNFSKRLPPTSPVPPPSNNQPQIRHTASSDSSSIERAPTPPNKTYQRQNSISTDPLRLNPLAQNSRAQRYSILPFDNNLTSWATTSSASSYASSPTSPYKTSFDNIRSSNITIPALPTFEEFNPDFDASPVSPITSPESTDRWDHASSDDKVGKSKLFYDYHTTSSGLTFQMEPKTQKTDIPQPTDPSSPEKYSSTPSTNLWLERRVSAISLNSLDSSISNLDEKSRYSIISALSTNNDDNHDDVSPIEETIQWPLGNCILEENENGRRAKELERKWVATTVSY